MAAGKAVRREPPAVRTDVKFSTGDSLAHRSVLQIGTPCTVLCWLRLKVIGRRSRYNLRNMSNGTSVLQRAVDACGDLPNGGTVLVPRGMVVLTGSVWLRSNLTLRVEGTLLGTATGSTASPASVGDAPMVYTRRNSLMVTAHAGLLNGGRCKRMKQRPLGGDDCADWTKLSNVVIEGAGTGTLDGNGDDWYKVFAKIFPERKNLRPVLLDLLWIDGLTIRDLRITRPGYWTVKPTFCSNVVVENNTIDTWNEHHAGSNTDGVDIDSSWNCWIGLNRFSTGDDCISFKAGRDWSGRLVNISTANVLAERNQIIKGHGITIGSETAAWVRNITVRDSDFGGADLAVRIKTERGRGGGAEDILYENLHGATQGGIQLTSNYDPGLPATNLSATPVIRRITLRNVTAHTNGCTGPLISSTPVCALSCEGLSDSPIQEVIFDGVRVVAPPGSGGDRQHCSMCHVFGSDSWPSPCAND